MRPRRKLCFRPGRRRSRTESDTESPMRWKAACVHCCTAMPSGHGIFCLFRRAATRKGEICNDPSAQTHGGAAGRHHGVRPRRLRPEGHGHRRRQGPDRQRRRAQRHDRLRHGQAHVRQQGRHDRAELQLHRRDRPEQRHRRARQRHGRHRRPADERRRRALQQDQWRRAGARAQHARRALRRDRRHGEHHVLCRPARQERLCPRAEPDVHLPVPV